MANLPIPTEEVEQRIFVQWLKLKQLPHFRVPNETYTKSYMQRAKNTALGVSSGVPDLFVVIPNKNLIGIEMKRLKGSVISPTQKAWIEILNAVGVPTYICYGADAAIAVINKYLTSKVSAKQTDPVF